jgi:hypothetical protein
VIYSYELDVISNPPIRIGLDFKSSHFDPVCKTCADLKSSLVLIVGCEILLQCYLAYCSVKVSIDFMQVHLDGLSGPF